MKQFQFSLQALRTLRERQEQVALQQYSAALRALEEARNALAAVQQELEAAWNQMRQSTQTVCAALELNRIQAYCRTLDEKRAAGDRKVKAAQRQTRLVFARLLAARKARAVVDKFFEKQKGRHERERQRHEQHALDEMAHPAPAGGRQWSDESDGSEAWLGNNCATNS
jgi:flagellar export protein FliJ